MKDSGVAFFISSIIGAASLFIISILNELSVLFIISLFLAGFIAVFSIITWSTDYQKVDNAKIYKHDDVVLILSGDSYRMIFNKAIIDFIKEDDVVALRVNRNLFSLSTSSDIVIERNGKYY